MTDEHILERVRKLLALSQSDNVNEAAAAAKQAQVLMSKHQISEAMLDVDVGEEDEAIGTELLHNHGKRTMPSWKRSLATVVAQVNQCKAFRQAGSSRLQIVGRPSDCDTARYFFTYLIRQVEEVAQIQGSVRGRPGRTWYANFRQGATVELCRRLREADEEARAALKQEADASDTLGSGTALVKVNTAIAKIDDRRQAARDYAKRVHGLKRARRSASNYDPDGFNAGKRAGERIKLDGAAKGLGRGSKGVLPS